MGRVAPHWEPESIQGICLGETIQAISNRGFVWVASLSLAMTGECAGAT